MASLRPQTINLCYKPKIYSITVNEVVNEVTPLSRYLTFYHLIKEPFGDNLICYTFRKIQRYVMCERKLALNGKKAHVKLDILLVFIVI